MHDVPPVPAKVSVVLPAMHITHGAPPAVSLYCPAGHAVQTLLLLYTVPDVPTSHKHAITDVDAVLPPVLELAGHSEQFAVPTELLYRPAAHASHLSDSLLRMRAAAARSVNVLLCVFLCGCTCSRFSSATARRPFSRKSPGS